MIFDALNNASFYNGLGYNLPAALKYLQDHDLNVLQLGRTDLNGDALFALAQEYETKPLEQGVWESHRKYIDIQYIQLGRERMGVANLSTMQLGEYSPEKDFQPMSGSGSFIDLSAGMFVIFFPQDAHMPVLSLERPEPVRKIVLKVRI